MKTYPIHTIPVLLNFILLILTHHTFNPISLKGPHFLKFYLILIFGFYISVFALKRFKQSISKPTLYFMISIFLLGIVKLVKGVSLGKPVGFLITILIMESIVGLLIINFHFKRKMN